MALVKFYSSDCCSELLPENFVPGDLYKIKHVSWPEPIFIMAVLPVALHPGEGNSSIIIGVNLGTGLLVAQDRERVWSINHLSKIQLESRE